MIGKTLGHYSVSTLLGKGGMGVVYQAKDQKLGRDVAIKVLPEEFARDVDRVARFQREAKMLASLNHPNIAAIHGMEESDGAHFLVLELVEGDTLSDQLKRGSIPVEEALKLALQIAEALEAAHEKGVIHRDLKPANIKVTPDGKVKVLDFGLAKAFTGDQADVNPADSPTITAAATQRGVILGTAAYMSPEQARGESVDKKADIWAFGVVLFEMLTGRQVFTGKTVSDTLASVLAREPEWNGLPPNLHPRIKFLLERCLEKETNNRYHDIADVRVEVQKVLDDPSGVFAQPFAGVKPIKGVRLGVPWIAAIFILGLIIAGIAVWHLKPSEPSMIAHVKMSLQPADQIGSSEVLASGRPTRTALTFSPDGYHIVFCGESGDPPISQLYLRALDSENAEPLVGTEGAIGPFFSPDGKWIGFWADGELKKLPITGGPASTICNEAEAPFGASWGSNNRIVFGRMDGGLLEVPASGGEPKALTLVDSAQGEWSHRLPRILPDGKAVLFTIARRQFPNWDESDIAVQSLESGQRKLLIRGGADGRYIQSGHLVFARKGALMAAPFDPGRLEMTGDAIAIIDDVMQAVNTTGPSSETGATQFTISNAGSLAYLSGGMVPDVKGSIVFMDRHGTIKPVADRPGIHFIPRFSPDGNRLAFFTFSRGEHSVWIYDLDREAPVRMTKSYGAFPLWTPDGSRLVFENHNLFWQPIDLSTPPEQLTDSEFRQFPVSWMPDGKTLVFVQTEASGSHDIWELSLNGDRRPRPLVQTQANEWDANLSPDGHWLAYSSDESGQEEVYVMPYPGSGGKTQISVDGGAEPAWARSGKELFYINRSNEAGTAEIRIVDITFGPPFKASKPRALFKTAIPDNAVSRAYDVTPDGQLFVACLDERVPPPDMSEIHVIFNWFEELKERVPVE